MKELKFIGIIPARYASTRFPGKPLAKLGGKYVIQRVYEQVSKVLPNVVVALDDERIADAVSSFGGKWVMTRTDHKCCLLYTSSVMPPPSSRHGSFAKAAIRCAWAMLMADYCCFSALNM